MKTLLFRTLPLLVLSALVTGCGSDPTGAEGGSFLRATLKSMSTTAGEPITIEHRGGANWSGGTRSDTQRMLEVYSPDREADRSLMLQRLSSSPQGPFQPGVHSLVPRNFNAGDNDGFTAKYLDHATGDHYIAESGTWTITGVSEDRIVSGSFDFVAAFWCNPHIDRDRCLMSPKEAGFGSDAVRLRVRGEFSAEPVRPVPELTGRY